jgi:hypothetical protein
MLTCDERIWVITVSRLISRFPKWNDMPFHEESFFQQDGAPLHYANVVKDYLNEAFGPRWIDRGVTKENASWPARSPDLTPCDFFLWGVIKDNVYKKEARNPMQLQQNFCEAFYELKEREDYLSHVMSLPERSILFSELFLLCYNNNQ